MELSKYSIKYQLTVLESNSFLLGLQGLALVHPQICKCFKLGFLHIWTLLRIYATILTAYLQSDFGNVE